MVAPACLMSVFHYQRAHSHRGLKHGVCESCPSKLHLPTKKSNMVYGLFFQKLPLGTVFLFRSVTRGQITSLLCMTDFFVALFGMVTVSCLSFLGAPSSPIFLLSFFPQSHAQCLKASVPLDAPIGPHPCSANTSCNTCAQTP